MTESTTPPRLSGRQRIERPEPTATLLRDYPGVQTVWSVTVPVKGGTTKNYHATTYPNSSLIFVQTGVRGRVVPEGVARNLLPVIRAAIERAKQPQTGAEA